MNPFDYTTTTIIANQENHQQIGSTKNVLSNIDNQSVTYVADPQLLMNDNENIIIYNKNHEISTNKSEDNIINNENDNIKILSEKIVSISQPFDAALNPYSSKECKLHSKYFLESLQNFDLWALKMYDSSAKYPSGILNGNINQFGDFNQCLKVHQPNGLQFQGKYCLAYLQPNIPKNNSRIKKIFQLVQSNGAFINEFNDPGHRVPRFLYIHWALCIPSTCTALDAEYSLKEYVKNLTIGTGLQFQIRVEKEMCQITENEPYDRNTKIAGLFFLTIFLISIMSTIIECFIGNPNQWLVIFSLKKNFKILFDLKRDPSDIGCIHGIRFLNALLLIVAHKSMALFFDPYINRTEMSEYLGKPWTVLGRAASIYTDPFLMFSGLLTSYSIYGRLQRGQSPNIFQDYVGRFLRIVPTLGALILFATYILPNLNSGPQWNLVVNAHATMCKLYWWRNLLFIHNYFGFENMCLTHTHHLGIDTELFLIAPILILIVWKWPKKGIIFLLILSAIGTYARFSITVNEKLSNYIYFGTSIKRLFKTADYMYTQPAYRSTIYILGIILGYILRFYKDYRFTKNQLHTGWCISVILIMCAFFGPAPMGSIHYKYNEYHAAIYAAFGPIGWCALFAWIVLTSHLGYDSLLNRILSWKGFLITTRLSYAIYLTQFPVFFYNVGSTRNPGYYEFFSNTINLYEYFWIIVTSIMLTIFFDIPFQNVKKILFPRKKSTIIAPSALSSLKDYKEVDCTISSNHKNSIIDEENDYHFKKN